MGVNHNDVLKIKGRLSSILRQAGVPQYAPELILNEEVSEEKSRHWKEQVLKTLNFAPELKEGRSKKLEADKLRYNR